MNFINNYLVDESDLIISTKKNIDNNIFFNNLSNFIDSDDDNLNNFIDSDDDNLNNFNNLSNFINSDDDLNNFNNLSNFINSDDDLNNFNNLSNFIDSDDENLNNFIDLDDFNNLTNYNDLDNNIIIDKDDFDEDDFELIKYNKNILITDELYLSFNDKLDKIKINEDKNKLNKYKIEDCILYPYFKKSNSFNMNSLHESNNKRTKFDYINYNLNTANNQKKKYIQLKNNEFSEENIIINDMTENSFNLKFKNLMNYLFNNNLFNINSNNYNNYLLTEINSLRNIELELEQIINKDEIYVYNPPKIYDIYNWCKNSIYYELKIYCIIIILDIIKNNITILFLSSLDLIDIDSLYIIYLSENELNKNEIIELYDELLKNNSFNFKLKLLLENNIFNENDILDYIVISIKNNMCNSLEKCLNWLLNNKSCYNNIISSEKFNNLEYNYKTNIINKLNSIDKIV
jgi:hypothetical protein